MFLLFGCAARVVLIFCCLGGERFFLKFGRGREFNYSTVCLARLEGAQQKKIKGQTKTRVRNIRKKGLTNIQTSIKRAWNPNRREVLNPKPYTLYWVFGRSRNFLVVR